MNDLIICGQSIAPGARQEVEAPFSEWYTADPVLFRCTVVRGLEPGPTVFVMAALHGDEINGVEVVRWLTYETTFQPLRGALVLVPVGNVFGFLSLSRYTPDRRDLNRSFPGRPDGSPAARLAHFLLREVVARCDFGIELHTACVGRRNLPHVRAELDDERTARLAHAFGCRHVLAASPPAGSLRRAARAAGVAVITFEAGSVLEFNEGYTRAGVEGCLRSLQALGMLEQTAGPAEPPLVLSKTGWLRAERGGIVNFVVDLGARVRKGDAVGLVTNPLGRDRHALRANRDGTVIGLSTLPLANPGDAVCHLAW
jgi:predicted deacylase